MPVTKVSEDGRWVLPSSLEVYEIVMKHSRRIKEESEEDRIAREVALERQRREVRRETDNALNELIKAAVLFRDASASTAGSKLTKAADRLKEAALTLPSHVGLDTKIQPA